MVISQHGYANSNVVHSWSAEKFIKLPPFLRGIAATHFYALSSDQKDSYDTLVRNLKAALCPTVCWEMFYADLSDRLLHDKEDPTVFLHSLRELLEKADPNMSIDANEALLARQFLKGPPVAMRLKLLEHNPIPQLAEMLSFSK